jgi:hypothetical protein
MVFRFEFFVFGSTHDMNNKQQTKNYKQHYLLLNW